MIWLIAGGASFVAAILFRLGQLSVLIRVMTAAGWLLAGLLVVIVVLIILKTVIHRIRARTEKLLPA